MIHSSSFWFAAFLWICGPALSSAQNTLTGLVIDSETGLPMQYVNVGIPSTTRGTVTDGHGQYALDVDGSEQPIIRYSYLGYQSVDLDLRRDGFQDTVRLQATIMELPLLVVRPLGKRQVLGSLRQKYRSKVNLAMESKPDQNLGSAVGRRFNVSEKVSLDTLSFYLSSNDFDSVTFRVQIMDLRHGKPDPQIQWKQILIGLGAHRQGWIQVDLKASGWTIDDDVMVCVEWVEALGKGQQLSFPLHYPTLGSTHYYRYGSQNRWKRFRAMATPMQLVVRPVDVQWD